MVFFVQQSGAAVGRSTFLFPDTQILHPQTVLPSHKKGATGGRVRTTGRVGGPTHFAGQNLPTNHGGLTSLEG